MWNNVERRLFGRRWSCGIGEDDDRGASRVVHWEPVVITIWRGKRASKRTVAVKPDHENRRFAVTNRSVTARARCPARGLFLFYPYFSTTRTFETTKGAFKNGKLCHEGAPQTLASSNFLYPSKTQKTIESNWHLCWWNWSHDWIDKSSISGPISKRQWIVYFFTLTKKKKKKYLNNSIINLKSLQSEKFWIRKESLI